MNKKYIIIISLLVLGLVSTAAVIISQKQQSSPKVKPEQAKTITEIQSILDDQTKTALENNIKSYTRHELDDFIIKEGSYQKLETGIKFQLISKTTSALYDIETAPSLDGTFNYVYVSCAPADEQYPGTNCEVDVKDE